jgi:DNA-binding beta-propeller fold protein YncE
MISDQKEEVMIKLIRLWLILLFSSLLLGITLIFPVTTTAVTQTQLATGLQAGVGVALDEVNNQLYYVEFTAGTLKRINLPPTCGITSTPACDTTIVTIADGFSHPEDVALDLSSRVAYVTTRDDPGTGGLWRIDIPPDPILAPAPKTLITFNLGAPQQIVLDAANNKAYTVGYDDGRLREINLTTGAKLPIVTGLSHPVGLAITSDRTTAYVTEQDAPPRISQVDLITNTYLGTVVDGLTAPFFLDWADLSENALYVVERDPVNRISRVDLTTDTVNSAVTSLPFRPSSVKVTLNFTALYTATDSELVKADLFDLAGPVFMGVGHVPASNIVDGYASTDPGYFYQVKHSPFGKTLNIFGNLVQFHALNATHYEVEVSKDGGPFEPINRSWNVYKWNMTTSKYELTPMAPDPGTTRYEIPLEADGQYHPEFWYPPFLFMRWASGNNGLYEFRVNLYPSVTLPVADNSLILRIDNTTPDAQLIAICQDGVAGPTGNPCYPDREVKACDIVSSLPNTYYFKITAYDSNHHLLSYWLKGLWGNNKSHIIYSDHYNNHIDAEGPYWWSGVFNFPIPRTAPGSGGSLDTWASQCNCAHTFYLRTWKRTINGYNYIYHNDWHKSVTLNNSGKSCGDEPCGFPCP